MVLDNLPSEILLQILRYLSTQDIIRTQCLSHRFYTICRDSALWKERCFQESHAERRRKHNLHLEERSGGGSGANERYAPLLRAMMDMQPQDTVMEVQAGVSSRQQRVRERLRILANWEPGYPGERIDYYEEYVQRHAPIALGWFEGADGGAEVTGVGALYGGGGEVAEKIVAAMEDGSVCIWEADELESRGRLVAKSHVGLLTSFRGQAKDFDAGATKATMTETGAVECVSVDSVAEKAYFAVFNELVEVDLRTVEVLSRKTYPFPITALSEAKFPTPMTVGTNMTLHMYDPRDSQDSGLRESEVYVNRIELIAGSPRSYSPLLLNANNRRPPATLTQPGPLSILHLPGHGADGGDDSIWVAGRFTSLLKYDRRFFPQLCGHLHSGARISCLRSTSHPLVPRELSLMSNTSMSASAVAEAKSLAGTTLLAAGEYKGKGSLELHGLYPGPSRQSPGFQNRQTASRSKLLAVSPHGGRIVYADGDGNVRWVERDAFSPVRTWNLNEAPSSSDAAPPRLGVFDGLAGQAPEDIVQMLLPTRPKATTVRSGRFGEDNLVIWTGEGKLGLLGFGGPKWEFDESAEEVVEREGRREERDYDSEMGMALRAHANELNFMRGLGVGGGSW